MEQNQLVPYVERLSHCLDITLWHAHLDGRITATRLPCPHACKDAKASAQKERIIGIEQQRADIKLSAAAMDDPNGKGAIVDVTIHP